MNKKIFIILSSILLLGLTWCYTKEVKKTQPVNQDWTVIESEMKNEKKVVSWSYHDMTNAPFAYRDYNGQDLSNLGAQTVLFFAQASCGTCQKTDTDLKSQAELPEGVSVLKIDFDTETALNKKYGVTTKHTFVLVDANGNEIAKEIGLNTTAEIAEFITKNNNWSQEASTNEETTTQEVTAEDTNTNLQEVATQEVTIEEAPIEVNTITEEQNIVEEASIEPTVVAASTKGTYKEYTGLPGEEVVLFFSASWCPSCVAADRKLSAETELSISTDVLKVDYDSNKDLRDKYGVTSQHTFVRIDAEGNLIKKMAGWGSSSDLQALFN